MKLNKKLKKLKNVKKLTKLDRFINEEKKFTAYKKHPTISNFSGGGGCRCGGGVVSEVTTVYKQNEMNT